MAHPFADKVKSGSSAKFKSITGKKSSGQSHPDGAQDSKAKAAKGGYSNEYKVGGAVSSPRADKFARGGKTKGKKGTNINIAVIAPGGKEAGAGAPPGLPPGLGPKPPMALPPPGPGGGGIPPGMPPMKTGGVVKYASGGAAKGQGSSDRDYVTTKFGSGSGNENKEMAKKMKSRYP